MTIVIALVAVAAIVATVAWSRHRCERWRLEAQQRSVQERLRAAQERAERRRQREEEA